MKTERNGELVLVYMYICVSGGMRKESCIS